MRDTIELELRGKPVALITATARVVEVTKRDGAFHVTHAFAGKIGRTMGSPWAAGQLAKFGYHRALRLAGCRDGDPVCLSGTTFEWRYPTSTFELGNMPAGFGKWCSAADGIAGLRTVTTPDPIGGLDPDEVASRALRMVPEVVSILTGR